MLMAELYLQRTHCVKFFPPQHPTFGDATGAAGLESISDFVTGVWIAIADVIREAPGPGFGVPKSLHLLTVQGS